MVALLSIWAMVLFYPGDADVIKGFASEELCQEASNAISNRYETMLQIFDDEWRKAGRQQALDDGERLPLRPEQKVFGACFQME